MFLELSSSIINVSFYLKGVFHFDKEHLHIMKELSVMYRVDGLTRCFVSVYFSPRSCETYVMCLLFCEHLQG